MSLSSLTRRVAGHVHERERRDCFFWADADF
jgi:hypothetical protein